MLQHERHRIRADQGAIPDAKIFRALLARHHGEDHPEGESVAGYAYL